MSRGVDAPDAPEVARHLEPAPDVLRRRLTRRLDAEMFEKCPSEREYRHLARTSARRSHRGAAPAAISSVRPTTSRSQIRGGVGYLCHGSRRRRGGGAATASSAKAAIGRCHEGILPCQEKGRLVASSAAVAMRGLVRARTLGRAGVRALGLWPRARAWSCSMGGCCGRCRGVGRVVRRRRRRGLRAHPGRHAQREECHRTRSLASHRE